MKKNSFTQACADLMRKGNVASSAGGPGMRAFISNSGWLVFDKFIRMLLGVLVGAWVARYLGPAQYGQLSYALAYVAIFLPIAGLGADGITVRDLAKDPLSAPQILGTALRLRTTAGLLCLTVAVIGALLINRNDNMQVLLAAILGVTLVFQAADTVDLWFQSRSQSRRTVTAKLTAYLLTNGLKIALIALKAPLISFALVLMLDAAAAAAALGIAYVKFPTAGRWNFSAQRARKLLGASRPFIVGGFLLVLNLRIDQLMVEKILGTHELGIYAASVWIMQVWQVIPLTLATSLGPYIARRKASDEGLYRRTLVIVFRAFFYAGVASTLVTYVMAPFIVRVIYGHEYEEAVPVMRLYAFTLPLLFLSLGHNLWLFNEGKYMVRAYGAVIASACTVAIILYLSHPLGVLSACIAAIVSQAIAYHFINAALDREAYRMQRQAIFFR